jgi:hypothetical protein
MGLLDKIAGVVIGTVTNIIPGSTGLRNTYSPTNPSDYNSVLRSSDQAAAVLGAALVEGGSGAVATGGIAAAAGGALTLTGVGAPVGAPLAVAGVAVAEAGAATAVGGVVLMANSNANSEAGYSYGEEKNTNSGSESTKSRSKPSQTGTPNSSEIQAKDASGKTTKYTTYDENGKFVKEFRGAGQDHGNIPRPNIKEPVNNTNPNTGIPYQNGYNVRPANPWEIPQTK